ncbi:MAG: ABC transporter ATP-binding protein [Rickettsiales bacterium]|nr:ABC transporter ATP-binding protein [Rickettsiales bacterium]
MKAGAQNTILSFLWSIIKPYKWWYVLMLQAPIISSFYKVVNSLSLKLLVDSFAKNQVPQYLDLLLPISLFIGAIFFLEMAWRVSHFAWMKSQPFVRIDITAKAYEHISNSSYEFFQNTHSGSIVSKIKGIVAGYNNFWFSAHHRLANPILEIFVTISALAFINLQLFVFMVLWCAVFFPVMLKMSLKVSKLAKETTDSQHKSIGLIADNVTNIFSLFSFAARARELRKINNFLKNDTAKKDYFWIKYELKMAFVGIFFYTSMLISLLFFLIHLRRIDSITIGDFVFVMTLSVFLIDNTWMLVSEIGDFLGKMGDFKSSFSILQNPVDTIDKPNAKDLKIKKGEIIFQNISFAYENSENIFDCLNLHIKAGEKVGLVGYSGAGKSTLIALLLKNFAALNGEIIIDEQKISEVSSDSLRAQIALIPQDTMLFHRSIAENIGYGKENSNQQEIEHAAKLANIHEFIMTLPNGYKTLVGERGIKLSGGQRQRVAIARAILKDAPILILDEATSSLDSKTEREIQASLNLLIADKSKTVIAIAHRLSTLKHLDRIIVLQKGKIIEEGKHEELLTKHDSLYKKLWELQAI